jgi:hypothetical protein
MSTISTSGIAPSSIIRAEHVLRVINALSNVSENDILITGSLTVTGSTALSGSLRVTGGITGSVFGTSSNATSASYAVNARNATSASYALTASYAVSASYEINYETSSSYAENATSASYSTVAQTLLGSVTSASYALTASYALNSPGGGGTTNTGSLLLTASATNNVITFTKGDASTFNITVNTGSASSINTGSFATTGSNQFSGSQGITGSVSITGSQSITGSLSVDSGTIINSDAFSIMSVYPNFISIENQGSPFDNTLLSLGVLSYNSASNSQQLLFPASLSTGIKAITLPNDNGTVALTYNTATTGSNTFTGNQTINANLSISASRTMSIVGPLAETYVTEGQVSISPNYSGVDQATLSGGNLSLSKANGTSTIVLTNRNSPSTAGDHLTSITFNGKSTDANLGLKGGIRATTVGGTGANMSLNLFTSASGGFGTFNAGDLDMRISSGSSIELFRNTTISGSLKQGHLVTSSGNFSHAEGYKSQAVGQYSHAEGGGPAGTFTEQLGGRATGTGSHAEGSFTLASGSFSHAEGQFTTASAPWSHTEGLGTIANGWYQHVQGAYNAPSSEQGAFIIGNGVADEVRSNLLFASGELIQVTGSVSITSVLTLTPNDPLPSAQPTGSIAVSGSGVDCKPYFWNGATWTSMI